METKKCTKCKEEKTLDNYYKDSSRKNGFANHCKKCSKQNYINFKLKNPEYEKIKNKKFRENNPNYSKEWFEKNQDYFKSDERRIKLNNYLRERRINDNLFKIKGNIRTLFYKSLHDLSSKNQKLRTEEILGCTFEEFKSHLESKFEPWMTWNNHGLYNGELNFGWDIDHVIPISSAKTEEEIYKLNHFSNFQPLCSKVNRDIKINKIK